MSTTEVAPVLIAGQWRMTAAAETFQASNPRTRQPLAETFPVSGWSEIDAALTAATAAAAKLRAMPDAAVRIADFLERYASAIEASADAIVAAAHEETGLPVAPRLRDIELPRAAGQLRQAAGAARSGDWQRPVLDTKAGLRSCLAPIGPVLVIGPNNFPIAFHGIAGGDFAAAIAAGNPVVGKGHPLHPKTSRLLAEVAHASSRAAGLPDGTVQLLYHLSPEDGLRAVGDGRLKSVAFTGSRAGGLKLKAAADAAGTLFFGEMSSINPTVLLPGVLVETGEKIAEQFAASVLTGSGQFCTKPGLVLLQAGEGAEAFVRSVVDKLSAAPGGVLFSASGQASLASAVQVLQQAGATIVLGGTPNATGGFGIANTLLRTTADAFLQNPHVFQTEAFGNAALVVVADDLAQMLAVIGTLEGNLTGTIYSATTGEDDSIYTEVAFALRPKVGRLLNDKMPTGVAVSPAQNHGGPYPATSQPHFSAVGIPGSIARFTQLESYDTVREPRLPVCLRDKNFNGQLWRQVDGNWTQADL